MRIFSILIVFINGVSSNEELCKKENVSESVVKSLQDIIQCCKDNSNVASWLKMMDSSPIVSEVNFIYLYLVEGCILKKHILCRLPVFHRPNQTSRRP